MGNHTNEMKEIEDNFIDKIADNMKAFGVQGSLGQVLGTIYMNRKAMTLDELADETGMSKTRMSQIVREMIDMNIAERVHQKYIRKDLFEVEQDYYDTFISIFTDAWRKAIDRNRNFEKKVTKKLQALQEKEDSFTAEEQELYNELVEELDEWATYYDWIRRLNEFFESGEVFKYVPKNNNI